jgi:hypothetical protein
MYSAMEVSAALKAAIHANDLAHIRSNLPQGTNCQLELNECLTLAMPDGSHETIGLILQLGAKLKAVSLRAAITRSDPAVFQLLIDSGWDINSTEFELSAVQYVRDIQRRHELLISS